MSHSCKPTLEPKAINTGFWGPCMFLTLLQPFPDLPRTKALTIFPNPRISQIP